MAKVIKRIIDVILILLIILLCSYFALRFFNRIVIYSVETGSMEENIHAGDYILVVKKDKYEVGDVITYKSNNAYITHRIIDKKNGEITTKGDANNIEDEKIDESVIVGKVMLSGGVLNIIINYKYTIVGVLLSLYLFSCYFLRERKAKEQE